MDKKTITRVADALADAEKNLQLVIGETAMGGDYTLSQAASVVAEEVKRLRSSLRSPVGEAVVGDPRPRESRTVSPTVAARLAREAKPKSKPERLAEKQAAPKRRQAKRSASVNSQKSPAGYPRFEIRRHNLHRIGWSKKGNEEYVHKAPREVYDQAIDAMAALAERGRGPFMADEFLEELADLVSHAPPSYQVYVVLGFLRHAKCIEQVGREGYVVPMNLKGLASSAWERCATDGESR